MSNKTISISPSLFNINGGLKTRRRDKKTKPTNVPLISPNVLKNKLLNRIKEHKKKETLNLANKKPDIKINTSTLNSNTSFINEKDDFQNSIEYFDTLARQKKINDEKENYERLRDQKRQELERMTVKNYQSLNSATPYVNIDLPEELMSSIHTSESPPINLKYNIDNNVPYGILKGGIKPTYKDWTRKQRDMEVTNHNSSLIIQGGGINRQNTDRENRLRNLREKIKLKNVIETQTNVTHPQNQNQTEEILMTHSLIQKPQTTETFINPKIIQTPHTVTNSITHTHLQPTHTNLQPTPTNLQPIPTHLQPIPTHLQPTPTHLQPRRQIIKKTIKRKYTLGKSKLKNKVAVLLKDRGTRKLIISAQKDLKRKSINDIKTYLRDHNLIKIGSNAPNDVLRKLYESCMLSGEITNKNTDILLHNLHKDDKDI
jgi:hypothetical protein